MEGPNVRLPQPPSFLSGAKPGTLPAWTGEIRKAAPMMNEAQVMQWLEEREYVRSNLKVTNHPKSIDANEVDDVVVGIVEGIFIRGIKDGPIVASLAEGIVQDLGSVMDRDFGKYSLIDFGFLRTLALRIENGTLHCDSFFTLTTSECPKGAVMLEDANRAVRASLEDALQGSPLRLGDVVVHHGGREWAMEDSPTLLAIQKEAGPRSSPLVGISVRGQTGNI